MQYKKVCKLVKGITGYLLNDAIADHYLFDCLVALNGTLINSLIKTFDLFYISVTSVGGKILVVFYGHT